MSALDPSGPSQPTTSAAYTTSSNPSSKTPAETRQSHTTDSTPATDTRIPTKQATHAQGLANAKFEEGKGVHGAPAGEEAKGLTEEQVGRHRELDGEQMAAPGEGRVADAVRGASGGGGEQVDLAADLDRKKAEQAEAREAIKASKGQGAGVGGALGQSGGPAKSSSDKHLKPIKSIATVELGRPPPITLSSIRKGRK
ncbi:hypothetical protein IQ07DRAFT_676208 [Pyrenochaeta sp. DS3sAY3a]|nr:hypothetical protein IQ07DRAFT_676208 [Pyrenochaeta sp. DS3sAY3a]